MRRGVWGRRPAGDLRDRLFGQGEHSGLAGILVAGNQDGLGLLLQSGNSDPVQASAVGGLDSGVQTAQVHVGGNHKGLPLIDGVPDGHIQGRRLVFLLQCGPGQPGAVVGLGHDLKLHSPGVVAGQKVNWELEAAVRSPVGDQLSVGLGVGLQFGEDILIALAGKDERPLCPREPGGLVGEGGQFIRQDQLADPRADIVDGAEQIAQVGDGRYPGTAPGVSPTPPCDGRQEQRGRIAQFFRCCRKNIDVTLVGCERQICQSQAAVNRIFMIGFGQVWQE